MTKEPYIYPDGRMDTENTALYIGLAVKTLAQMRCNGTGPSFIKKGRIFYYQEDIISWLNEGGRAKSTAEILLASY